MSTTATTTAAVADQTSTNIEKQAEEKSQEQVSRRKARISCVAVVAPNNAPLYMRIFDATTLPTLHSRNDDAALQMQELIYNSLDVVEERMSSIKSRQLRENDGFLGCLAVVGTTCLYGNVTNTGHKVILAVKGGGEVGELDAAIRAGFRRLRRALVIHFMNALLPLGGPIRSKNFDKEVEEVVRWFG